MCCPSALPDQAPARLLCAHVSDLVLPLLLVPGREFLAGQEPAQRMVLLHGWGPLALAVGSRVPLPPWPV